MKREKVLSLDPDQSWEEVEVLWALSHPNIMKLYDVIEVKDVYLILEYCEGWSLLDVIIHHWKRFEPVYTEKEAAYLTF